MVYPDPTRLARETGLEIRSPVLEAVLENITECIACGTPRPPLGLYKIHDLADWARHRAKKNPLNRRAEAAHLAGLHMEDDTRCQVCYARLGAFVGIPEHLLFPLINGLRGAQRKRIMGFLETRFVFPFCRACVESEHEERVTVATLKTRYDRARALLEDADLAPLGSDSMAAEVFMLLDAEVRTRGTG